MALSIIALGFLGLPSCDPSFQERFASNLQNEVDRADDPQRCGNGGIVGLVVQDCPFPPACFTTACTSHDDCYGTCGADRAACDAIFLEDMFAACSDAFFFYDTLYLPCRYTALSYLTAVREFGDRAYRDSQAHCFVEPEIRVGACCQVGDPPICDDDVSEFDCPALALFFADTTCENLVATTGGCPVPVNDDCNSLLDSCIGQAPLPDWGRCEGDELIDGGGVCSISLQDCANRRLCVSTALSTFRCLVDVDVRLATTDGPSDVGECSTPEESNFQSDVWFEYSIPCSGTLAIRMCGLGDELFDSMLAVYGSMEVGNDCTCPTGSETLLACDDDYCGGGSQSGVTIHDLVEGACLLIRVGAWSGNGSIGGAFRGSGMLDIGMFCQTDPPLPIATSP